MSASWLRAWRLILARPTLNQGAGEMIGDEIGDCPHCWRGVAEDLADIAASDMISAMGYDNVLRHTDGCRALRGYGFAPRGYARE